MGGFPPPEGEAPSIKWNRGSNFQAPKPKAGDLLQQRPWPSSPHLGKLIIIVDDGYRVGPGGFLSQFFKSKVDGCPVYLCGGMHGIGEIHAIPAIQIRGSCVQLRLAPRVACISISWVSLLLLTLP